MGNLSLLAAQAHPWTNLLGSHMLSAPGLTGPSRLPISLKYLFLFRYLFLPFLSDLTALTQPDLGGRPHSFQPNYACNIRKHQDKSNLLVLTQRNLVRSWAYGSFIKACLVKGTGQKLWQSSTSPSLSPGIKGSLPYVPGAFGHSSHKGCSRKQDIDLWTPILCTKRHSFGCWRSNLKELKLRELKLVDCPSPFCANLASVYAGQMATASPTLELSILLHKLI